MQKKNTLKVVASLVLLASSTSVCAEEVAYNVNQEIADCGCRDSNCGCNKGCCGQSRYYNDDTRTDDEKAKEEKSGWMKKKDNRPTTPNNQSSTKSY